MTMKEERGKRKDKRKVPVDEFTIVNCKTRASIPAYRPALTTTNVTRTPFIHFYLGSKTTVSRKVENTESFIWKENSQMLYV